MLGYPTRNIKVYGNKEGITDYHSTLNIREREVLKDNSDLGEYRNFIEKRIILELIPFGSEVV